MSRLLADTLATLTIQMYRGLPKSLQTESHRLGLRNIAILAGASLAPSTRRKYELAWTRFKAWLPSDVHCFHCTGVVLSLYLSELFLDCQERQIGSGALDLACAAIAFHYQLAGVEAPLGFPNIKLLRRAADKILTSTRSLCGVLSNEAAASMLTFHLLGATPPSLRVRMHLTVFLLMYVGLLRYADAAQLLVHSDLMQFITRSSTDHTLDGVLLFLPKSKTDVKWEGAWVAIGATGTALCPVRLLYTLLDVGSYDVLPRPGIDNGPLLRAVVLDLRSPHSHRLAKITTPLTQTVIPPLSYTTLRQSLLLLSAEAGLDTHFGLHTGRVGYANTAATNRIPVQLVCHLGRWKIGNTFDDTYTRMLEDNSRKFFALTRTLWRY